MKGRAIQKLADREEWRENCFCVTDVLFFTVIILQILVGAEVDLFIPSLPEMQEVFGLSPFAVEMVLSLNLVAYCLASLVVGNLGDRYGRRPVLLLGLGLFLVGSLMCVIACNFSWLLVGRILQGLGAAAPSVLCYLFIADLYPVHEQQQKAGVLHGMVTLAMAAAPIAGSYIARSFGWRGNFSALLLFGLFSLLLSVCYLPKGAADPRVKLSVRAYLPLFRSKKFLLYLVTICFAIQTYWVFIGLSPLLYIETLGVPLTSFGFYQGALAGCFAFLSLASSYFLKKFGERRCLFFSIALLFAFFIGCLVLIIGDTRNPMAITGVFLCMSAGLVFPINILWPLSLDVIPSAKGRSAALMTSFRFLFTSAGLQVASFFYNDSFIPLGTVILAVLAIALLAGYWLLRHDPRILRPHSHANWDCHL